MKLDLILILNDLVQRLIIVEPRLLIALLERSTQVYETHL